MALIRDTHIVGHAAAGRTFCNVSITDDKALPYTHARYVPAKLRTHRFCQPCLDEWAENEATKEIAA